MTADGEKKRLKEANSRARQCFDGELTHIQIGWWRGPQVDAVTFVGRPAELHGTVCTCCPTRLQPRTQSTEPPQDGALSA